MKRVFAVAVLVVSVVAGAKTADELVKAGTPEEQGTALAQELLARNAGWKDLAGTVEMTLTDASGAEANRKFSLKVLERASKEDGDKSLIVFEAPADVKGTAVLSHASASGEDEQWLFLPSTKRTKRISAANRTGAFAGSEFSFEDLTGNDARKYGWKVIGEAACGEATCLQVEAVPKDSGSAYSKRVLFVDKAELRIARIEFFDKQGGKLKTLAYGDWQKLGEKYWRAQKWEMKNHQSGKGTTIRFASMKLGNGFTVADFAQAKLGR